MLEQLKKVEKMSKKSRQQRPKTLEIKPPAVPVNSATESADSADQLSRKSSNRNSWRRTPVRRKMTPEQRQAFVYGRHSTRERKSIASDASPLTGIPPKGADASISSTVDHKRSKSATSLFYTPLPSPTAPSDSNSVSQAMEGIWEK